MTKPSDLLKDARERSDQSQAALAERLGVSQPCIHKWESGESIPKPGDTRRISEAYGVSHKKLLSAVLAALEARSEAKAS